MDWVITVPLAFVMLAVWAAYIYFVWVVPIQTFKDDKASTGQKARWGFLLAIFGVVAPGIVLASMYTEYKAQFPTLPSKPVNVNVQGVNIGSAAAK